MKVSRHAAFFAVAELQGDVGVVEVGMLHYTQSLVYPDVAQKRGERFAKGSLAKLVQPSAVDSQSSGKFTHVHPVRKNIYDCIDEFMNIR